MESLLGGIAALVVLLAGGTGSAWAGQTVLDHLFTAQEWQAKGNLEAARRSVRAALDEAPSDAYARIRLAQIEAASGNRPAALDILGKVLADEPDNLLALAWQGHLLLAGGRPEEALTRYEAVLKVDPGNAWAWLGQASCLLDRGMPREAASALAKAQSLAAPHPGAQGGSLHARDAALHRALGEAFLSLGLAVNARLELERALEADPRDHTALALAGRAYLALGLEGLALDAWRQALSLDPAAQPARADLVELLGRQAGKAAREGRADQAVRLWRQALSLDPRDPASLAGLRALQGGRPARAAPPLP